MTAYLKDTNNKIAKIKTEINKNILNNIKKIKTAIEKNRKDTKRINDKLKIANKNLKNAKTAAIKKKQTADINSMKKQIAELAKSLIILKAKELHLKELAKLANKALKISSTTKKKTVAKKKPVAKKNKTTAKRKSSNMRKVA